MPVLPAPPSKENGAVAATPVPPAPEALASPDLSAVLSHAVTKKAIVNKTAKVASQDLRIVKLQIYVGEFKFFHRLDSRALQEATRQKAITNV